MTTREAFLQSCLLVAMELTLHVSNNRGFESLHDYLLNADYDYISKNEIVIKTLSTKMFVCLELVYSGVLETSGVIAMQVRLLSQTLLGPLGYYFSG